MRPWTVVLAALAAAAVAVVGRVVEMERKVKKRAEEGTTKPPTVNGPTVQRVVLTATLYHPLLRPRVKRAVVVAVVVATVAVVAVVVVGLALAAATWL